MNKVAIEDVVVIAARAAKRAAVLLTNAHIYYEDMKQAAALSM